MPRTETIDKRRFAGNGRSLTLQLVGRSSGHVLTYAELFEAPFIEALIDPTTATKTCRHVNNLGPCLSSGVGTYLQVQGSVMFFFFCSSSSSHAVCYLFTQEKIAFSPEVHMLKHQESPEKLISCVLVCLVLCFCVHVRGCDRPPQQDPGVIPRLCKGLFKAIKELGPSKDVSIVASYVEV